MPSRYPTLRFARVRCGDRSLDGVRRRRRLEREAWRAFEVLAMTLLRDRVGAERVGAMLVAVVTGRRPLNAVETWETFLRCVGSA